jgi:glycosyltransferase involved in cell wall biosynthesis
MNVALLHYSAPPVIGGVESVLAHQARLMAKAGHAVRVIAARGEAWNGIEFVRLPLADSRHPQILEVKAGLDAGRVPAEFETLTDWLVDELRDATQGVDVLIAHNVCSLNKNLALTQALYALNGSEAFPRLILWHHDLAWTTPRYRRELHDGLPWDLLRTDWPGVTQVTVSAIRQAELARLLGIPPERIHVVPNGMDVAAFLKFEPQTMAWVDRLSLLDAEPLLLLPVRITPRKNLELALHILAHLKEKLPAATLIVTGPLGAHNPANRGYLDRLLQLRTQLGLDEAAHFFAQLSDALLPDSMIGDLYRLSDALLLPSREEGFGIPLIEAALSHRPVFCADIPPLRELGLEDVLYFSPDGDPAQTAAAIATRLSGDPVFRFAARTRRHFTWEQIYKTKIEPLLSVPTSGFSEEESK